MSRFSDGIAILMEYRDSITESQKNKFERSKKMNKNNYFVNSGLMDLKTLKMSKFQSHYFVIYNKGTN